MRTLMGPTLGSVLIVVLMGSFLPAGPALTPLASPFILLSQIIESSPKPPTEQKPMRPLEQMPTSPIEQNPTPPTEQKPMRPLEQMPTPPTEQKPTPPSQN